MDFPLTLLSAHPSWPVNCSQSGDFPVTCLEQWLLISCPAVLGACWPADATSATDCCHHGCCPWCWLSDLLCENIYPLVIHLLLCLILSSVLIPSPIFPNRVFPKNDLSPLVLFFRTSLTIRYLYYLHFQNKIIWWLSIIRKIILENHIFVCYIDSFLGLLILT